MDRLAVRNLFEHDIGHFHQSGFYTNEIYYTGQTKPHQIHQNTLHSANVTVWCMVPFLGLLTRTNSRKIKAVANTFNISHYDHMIQTVSFLKSTR